MGDQQPQVSRETTESSAEAADVSLAAEGKNSPPPHTNHQNSKTHVVVLIHGTFAADGEDEAVNQLDDEFPCTPCGDHECPPKTPPASPDGPTPWWQRGSYFSSQFQEYFGACEVAPRLQIETPLPRTTTVAEPWFLSFMGSVLATVSWLLSVIVSLFGVGWLLERIRSTRLFPKSRWLEKLRQWTSFPTRMWPPRCNDSSGGNRLIETVFHWSGENSERCRREAGRRLYEHLNRIASQCGDNHALHVIAHSHGGSVLLEAFAIDQAKKKPGTKATLLEKRIQTWITVATPFLQFGADWAAMVAPLFVFMSVLVTALLYRDWYLDYWQQQGARVFSPDKVAGVCVSARVLIILCTSLPFRCLYKLYEFFHRGVEDTDRRLQARKDLMSSSLATVVAFALAAFFWWSINTDGRWLLTTTVRFWPPIWHLEFASLTTLLTVVTLAVSAWRATLPIQGWCIEWRRRRHVKAAWNAFKDRHRALPLGFERCDEPVRALHAIIQCPKAEIVPRIKGPERRRYFGSRLYLVNPERERLRNKVSGWLAGSLLLPFSIVVDWILKPFYNNVVCVFIDDFVLTRLWKTAQGADIPGLRMIDCLPLPLSADLSPKPNSCDAALKSVENEVQQAAPRLLHHVRSLLGGNYSEGVRLFDLLKTAFTAPKSSKLLFHTAYLQNQQVIQLLAETCCGSATGYAKPGPVTSRGIHNLDYSPQTGQIGFFWWALQVGIVIAVLSVPSLLLKRVADTVFYEWSRQSLWDETASMENSRIKPNDVLHTNSNQEAWVATAAFLRTFPEGKQLLEGLMAGKNLAYKKELESLLIAENIQNHVTGACFSDTREYVEKLVSITSEVVKQETIATNLIGQQYIEFLKTFSQTPLVGVQFDPDLRRKALINYYLMVNLREFKAAREAIRECSQFSDWLAAAYLFRSSI